MRRWQSSSAAWLDRSAAGRENENRAATLDSSQYSTSMPMLRRAALSLRSISASEERVANAFHLQVLNQTLDGIDTVMAKAVTLLCVAGSNLLR